MKYIIWGCGERGRVLSMLLGPEYISAFIDRNTDLYHATFMDIPIISFDEYLLCKRQELIIIAAKGHERSISQQLEPLGIPWIAVETPECIPVLCQIKQVMNKIIYQNDPTGIYVIYGWNVYGVYVYEWLRSHNRKCKIILQDMVTKNILKLGSDQLPIATVSDLKNQTIERIFFTEPVGPQTLGDIIWRNSTNIYEIYKELDLFFNSALTRFHNIHKGKRCFIVATGPSLRIDDLNTLRSHNEICLSVNGIFKAFDSTEWRPDYYFLSDIYGALMWKEEILQMNIKEKFIGDAGWLFDDVPSNICRYHLYYDAENRPAYELPLFAENASKCIYITGTVIYDTLQIAAYMGFSEIYLLGTDCTMGIYTEKQHFVENYYTECVNKNKNLEESNLSGVFAGYKVARKFCEEHGIKLYNATRGGRLDILERIEFDRLFNTV